MMDGAAFSAAAFFGLVFFAYYRWKCFPDPSRRARRIYHFYQMFSDSALLESDLWEKTARAYFDKAGRSPEESEKAVLTLRMSCEDFMARQDVLKTRRQKAVELARRILLLEDNSLSGRQGSLQDTERLHTAVEAAAARYFSK